MATKKCNQCDTEQPIDNFQKNKSSPDGYRSNCKNCMKKYREANKDRYKEHTKKHYETNKEKILVYAAKYREEHRDELKEYFKEYNDTRRGNDKPPEKPRERKVRTVKPVVNYTTEELKAYQREYYEKNRDRDRETHREWERKDRAAHPEKYAAKAKKWIKANRDKINEHSRSRYKNDPAYRISKTMRTMVRKMLTGCRKEFSTVQYVGCTPAELKKHLESQFDEHMTWYNCGTYWHVDHIVPMSFFDMTKEKDRLTCCHFSNLRPFPAEENVKKNGSLEAILPIHAAY